MPTVSLQAVILQSIQRREYYFRTGPGESKEFSPATVAGIAEDVQTWQGREDYDPHSAISTLQKINVLQRTALADEEDSSSPNLLGFAIFALVEIGTEEAFQAAKELLKDASTGSGKNAAVRLIVQKRYDPLIEKLLREVANELLADEPKLSPHPNDVPGHVTQLLTGLAKALNTTFANSILEQLKTYTPD